MDELLAYFYNACEPLKPASEHAYIDCAAARGGGSFVQDFTTHLSLKAARSYCCYLFSGHVGCGKSSELGRVCTTLRTGPAGRRYLPILLNVSSYLDDYDVAVPDILLAMVTELADTLRRELDLDLRDPVLTRIFDGLLGLLTDIDLQAELGFKLGAGPASADVKVKIQRLKKDPQLRGQVRTALGGHMTRLTEVVNQVFEVARNRIEQTVGEDGVPFRDFVIILDNLEKIRKLSGFAEGVASQRELFVERYTQLTGLSAHIIYTVPLRLLRSPIDGPQLQAHYGRSFVLPMIKIQNRDRSPYPAGDASLQQLLSRRLPAGRTLAAVFTPEALRFLLHYSGGHVRQLMTSVQNACTYTSGLPISLAAAQRAIAQTVSLYSASIPQGYWSKLAALESSANQMIENGDPDYLAMLEGLSVLEYLNGGTEEDPFSPAEPWYALNPVVRELRRFKDALAARSALGGAA